MNLNWWNKFFGQKTSFFAWLVTFVAALTYLFSVAGDAVIGESARLISEHSGVDPLTPLSYYLWGLTGRIFQWLPIGTLSFRWNLLSVLCGSIAIGLVCLLVSRLIGNTRDRDLTGSNPRIMRNIAGLTASLLLIYSTPFLLVSTMAHPATFNLVLFLISLWLTYRFVETSALILALASAFMLGITATQYATALPMIPIYGLTMLYWFWKKKRLRPVPILLTITAFAAGLSPYFIHAAYFMQKPAFHWAEMNSYWGVLWSIWREQYLLIRYGLPNVGWTIVLLFSLMPAFMVVVFRKHMNISTIMMLMVTAAVGVLLFFNIRFAPWPLLGFRPLLIMPYVIGAAWCGCLAAYGLSLSQNNWHLRIRRNRMKWLEPLAVGLYMTIIASFIVTTAVRNLQETNVRSSRVITQFAEAVANQIQDGQWVVVNQYLDPLLAIKLKETGKSALILSDARIGNPPFQNFLCDVLNDGHLCNMARLGLVPLLRERLHATRGDDPVVASIGDPGILRFIGQPAIPDRTLFSTSAKTSQDPETYMQSHRDLWNNVGRDLRRSADIHDAYRDTKNQLLLNLSRIANDAGLLLEDRKRPDLAGEAYREAARLFKYNISARLNLLRLVDRESEEYHVLTNEIETVSANLRGKTDLNQIMDAYGFIRHPGSIFTEAARWARSGSKELTTQALESSVNLKGLENAMTNMSDDEAYAFILNTITPPQPETSSGAMASITTNYLPGLVGAIRLSAMKNRINLARKLYSLLADLDLSAELLAIEDANIDLADGKREAAYQKLTALEESRINDPRAWIMLALIASDIKPNDAGRYLEKLEVYPNLPPPYILTLAKIYIAQADADAGAIHLVNYLRSRPLDQEALELLLGIRLDQKRMNLAMPLIKQLIQIDTRNALANYALGVSLYQAGRLSEARAAWEISLESKPAPETQNDLAYLYHKADENKRALELIDLALSTRSNATFWHTKAVILIALNRQGDAREAIEKGLALESENPDLLALKNNLPSPNL